MNADRNERMFQMTLDVFQRFAKNYVDGHRDSCILSRVQSRRDGDATVRYVDHGPCTCGFRESMRAVRDTLGLVGELTRRDSDRDSAPTFDQAFRSMLSQAYVRRAEFAKTEYDASLLMRAYEKLMSTTFGSTTPEVMSAREIELLCGIPENETTWFNHGGHVPAEHVAREALTGRAWLAEVLSLPKEESDD